MPAKQRKENVEPVFSDVEDEAWEETSHPDVRGRGGRIPGLPQRPAPPSFVICEGVRAELEQVGETTDPFTGKHVTRDDLK